MQEQLADIEQKIRKLKHTINVFNTTTVIPEFGITIDEMLVYLPQLNTRESRAICGIIGILTIPLTHHTYSLIKRLFISPASGGG